jgi:hypothetical protein
MPATTHTISAAPGDPACELTWLGDEKIPDPIISPTISDSPFRYVSVLCFSSEPPRPPPPPLTPLPPSSPDDDDAPSGA